MTYHFILKLLVLGIACLAFRIATADDKTLDTFRAQRITDVYYSEGASAGDLNNDGKVDFVYGPHWYEGPGFEVKHEIYPAKPQNREGYTDHFFAWVYDFDGDGWNDVFTVGFPGTPAFVYRNPGNEKAVGLWKKHQVFDWVSNESPQFLQLVGDDRPELVCARDGFFGYASIDWSRPFEPWKFTAVSAQVTDKKFGHGLGIGDVNGDGKQDVIHAKGWLQQPSENAAGKPWQAHAQSFSNAYGGAEMFAYDVDGDGDNDIITSIAAHDFGLAWFEQVLDAGERNFTRHDIMGAKPQDNTYGVVFSELHSVQLADVDGDGLKDIITGKTYYSHHKQSPMWDAGAVVYWFKLVRGPNGIDWVPFKAADEAGIGRQIGLFDLNQDGLMDITVGGMKGAHALFHQRTKVSEEAWLSAMPQRKSLQPDPVDKALFFEGEKLKVLSVSDGSASAQGMGGFAADHWSNDSQLWWTGGKIGSQLELELPVTVAGKYDVLMAFTKAIDYGIVQVSLDGVKLGDPIDLFNKPNVISTGVIRVGQFRFKQGLYKLTLEVVGKNASAVPGYMVGLDSVQLGVDLGEAPRSKAGKSLNLDFEKGTLEDWTATGDAFTGQPIRGDTIAARRKDMRSEHQGDFWIGTFERSGDKPTGTLTSAPFLVDKSFASYLVGGGSDNAVRVELIDLQNDKVIHRSSGRTTENMRQVVVNLASYQGKEMVLRLVDEGKTGWGHLNFDGFRLHASQPGPVSKSETVVVLDEYPFEGISAEAAAKAMTLPDGFKVIVGAAEPDVKQPIAMAFDDRGRVWIAEAYEYPQRAAEGKGRDRILVFEDTDGNGTLDKRKVFAEGLNLVSGMEVGFGGVWVGAAPYLMFIPDADGDDVADSAPRILLDGWGYQDTHETLNTFIWGPDGWLYGCHGVFTHSRVGKPGTPDKDRQGVNAAIWRYHPTRHTFEVFAHGTSNPWGVDFNDRGQAFLTSCVIPHLYHIIQGARYERQGGVHFNPYTYDDIKTIADHRHYIGATPHSGNGKSDEAGGGHAHAGAMIYLGGAWPKNYRDRIFMNNIHGQRLNVDILKPNGSGYVGSHSPDFLLTGDKASQILNLRYGPDGQAWMIDWYDMQACHLTDPGKHDRSNGRIYKIAYGDVKPSSVSLQTETDIELVQHTLHSNDWYVRHSRRVLQERSAAGKVSDDAIALLKKMVKNEADETRRLRAAWALAAMEKLDAVTCDGMLVDTNEYVRGWGIQLGLDSKLAASAVSPSKLAKMAAAEKSQVTRLYFASAAQRIPVEQRWELVTSLLANAADASDHNLPLMIWYAAEPLAEQDAERSLVVGLSATKTIPLVRNNMMRRIGAANNEQSLAVLVRGLGKAESEELQSAFLEAIRMSLAGRRKVDPPTEWEAVYSKLSKGPAAIQSLSQALGVTFGNEAALAGVRRIVEASGASNESRIAGIATLLGAKDPKLAPILHSLLTDKALRLTAIAGLAQYSDPKTSERILGVYAGLPQNEKRAALTTLSSRSEYAVPMLEAIDAKKIAASDLSADLVRQLEYLKNEKVKSLLEKNWGTVRESPAEKTKLVEEYRMLVQSTKEPKPDISLGRAIYAKTCQQCHVLFATGGNIGPELTGSNRVNLDYLLSNIVDPSSVMAKEYQPTILNCDGRIVTGIVKAEDAQSVTLQKVDAIEVVPLNEIAERKLSDKSMMPEDQLKLFNKHEIRSLIAYLANDRQVPVLATVANAPEFFNGKNLSYWRGNEKLWHVEGNELVGITTGIAKNEFLVSDFSVGDFHLKLEVKLAANAGNSGIQFRSQQTDQGMLGYQADIGPGWWGKLYEEEGRALLWDKSGEAHVKSGEWNVYEVKAQGSKIQTWINGHLCVDLDDPKGAKRGIIALQLHSGGPTEVRFRNVELKVLE